MTDYTARRQVFRALHESGTFLIPNPYDAGSAKLLAALGFMALASTSSGFAATLGRLDMNVTCDELVAHVGMLTAATEIPLNVDAERCFGETPEAVAETVRMLAAVGACGVSIEK